MAHRHNRIKRRKLLRFHSKKKYRRKNEDIIANVNVREEEL